MKRNAEKILRSQNQLSKTERHVLEICQEDNDNGKIQGTAIHVTGSSNWQTKLCHSMIDFVVFGNRTYSYWQSGGAT